MAGELMYSKGQIDRAGRTLRRAMTGDEPPPSVDEVVEATIVVDAFRRAHGTPMSSARASLRSCISSEGLVAEELSQRLKRMPTIVDKLRRLPTMKLSAMQDLGGCRAVLASQTEVARVRERFMSNSIQRNGVPDTVRDYVAQPRSSGYRAVHLWTRFGDRRVEVQLRTGLQHQWAMLVENITTLAGVDYKSGYGSEAVHDWLRMLSQSHAFDEAGVVVDSEFERDYTDKRMRAWTHITSSLEGRVRRHE